MFGTTSDAKRFTENFHIYQCPSIDMTCNQYIRLNEFNNKNETLNDRLNLLHSLRFSILFLYMNRFHEIICRKCNFCVRRSLDHALKFHCTRLLFAKRCPHTTHNQNRMRKEKKKEKPNENNWQIL